MNIATTAQQNYLDILFNELGFGRDQRNHWMKRELGREVNYIDELTVEEASRFIRSLRERKDDRATANQDRFNQGLAPPSDRTKFSRYYQPR